MKKELTVGDILCLRKQMRDQVTGIIPEGYKASITGNFFSIKVLKEGDAKDKSLLQIMPVVNRVSADGKALVYYEVTRIGNYRPFNSNCSLKVTTLEELGEAVKAALTLLSLGKVSSEISEIQL